MISCAHIHPASDLAGRDLAGRDLAGQRRFLWCRPVWRIGMKSAHMKSAHMKSAGIKGPGGIMMAGAALMLALAGCGHEAYEDSYPATSGVIVDGTRTTAGTAVGTAVGTAGDQAAGPGPEIRNLPQPSTSSENHQKYIVKPTGIIFILLA